MRPILSSRRIRARAALSAIGTVLALAGAAFGQSANVPSTEALIEALQSKGPSRGLNSVANSDLIKALRQKSSRGLSITSEEREQLSEVTKDLPAEDMDIPFDLDSAEITSRAEPAIEALGRALQDNKLKSSSFIVAGHTDATGSSRYNQKLSERRAQAVRERLVSEFKLSSEQLIAVGYGPQKPKVVSDPYSGQNRRVQIVNLGQ